MPSRTVSDAIHKLRSDILSGRIANGSLLPTEKELSAELKLSRPTAAKIYNALKHEGLLEKIPGKGTLVVFNGERNKYTFGLLLAGAGESEIFGAINDHFLAIEKENGVKFLWDGAIANNAQIRNSTIRKIAEEYLEKNVSGVFFAPIERTPNAAAINTEICDLISGAKVPLILIDKDIFQLPMRSRYSVVSLDNYSAGYIMTKHLIEKGAKHIYFIYRKNSASSIDKRITGMVRACFDGGMPFPKDCLISFDNAAESEFINTLKSIPKGSGILCGNDSTAAVLMSTLKEIGVAVSRDVIAAGFDDMKYGKLLQPSLTTFRQPLKEIVYASYELMMSAILKSNTSFVDLTFYGELIERESSKFQ